MTSAPDLSVSMASLYSEAELSKGTSNQTLVNSGQDAVLSAESVALSLISQFSEKQLPRASDLKWLVSEQEVDQQVRISHFCVPVNFSHFCFHLL